MKPCRKCWSEFCPGRFGDENVTCWTSRGFVQIGLGFEAGSLRCGHLVRIEQGKTVEAGEAVK